MDIVGLAEIADLFGVTKQVITNWRTRKPTFPRPVASLKSGPVWSEAAVRKWAAAENVPLASAPPAATKNEAVPAVVAALMNMKGGVGKSTVAANVGWFAAYTSNKRVLLIDLDPQFNLSQYILGVRGYERLLEEKAPTIDALFNSGSYGKPLIPLTKIVRRVHNWNDGSCLHLLPAGLELAFSMRNAADKAHVLRDGLDDIKWDYDLILIDCAPTESILSTVAYLAADYIFVPVRPEFLSTIGLPLLLQSLAEFKKLYSDANAPELGGIIFNDTGDKAEHERSRAFVTKVAKQHGLPLFKHSISHSDSYPTGARAGKPIFMTDNARSWKKDEFNRVAKEFLERLGL